MGKLQLSVLFLLIGLVGLKGFGQTPLGINYQGVARNMDGSPKTEKEISLRVSILDGGISGVSEYSEIHDVITNQFGLFTLIIGQGQNTGSIQDVNWQSGTKWLQIEMDSNGGSTYELIGAQQILSVPYAMYAAEAGSGVRAGDGISIEDGSISNTQPDQVVNMLGAGSTVVSGEYPNYIITSSDNVDDADPDPENELITQTELIAGSTLRITDAGGDHDTDLSSLTVATSNLSDVLQRGNDAGGTTISGVADPVSAQDATTKSYVDARNINDADADSSNEIQTLGQVGDQVTLSDGGGSVSVNDADSDPTNEIQDISLSGNSLQMTSDATPVDLSGYLDNTDSQQLSLISNSLTLTGGGAIDLSPYLDNTDSQDLFFGGDMLSISNGGTPIDLSGYLDNTDNQNLSFNALSGLLSIGGGNNVTITDVDATNEIQDLDLAGNILSLTDDVTMVDLSSYLDNTDNQDLTLVGDVLSLTNDGTTVDISGYLDNTDSQALSLIANSLTLSGGAGAIDLSPYLDNTDNQDLTLVGDVLSLTNDGTTVDISGYLDNTDSQALSLIVNSLTLSGGAGAIDLSPYLDNTDNQDLTLAGDVLSLTNDGTTVNLSTYLDNTDNQNLSNTPSGINRTIDISGGTSTTFSVADNDNDPTNERNTSGSYQANNSIRITDSGGNIDIPVGTLNANLDANNNRVTNLSDPINPQDAVTKNYLDIKDATDYAFKVILSFTSGGGDLFFDLSSFDFDGGGLISGTQITIVEDGIYSFVVKGSSSLASPADVSIVINSLDNIIFRIPAQPLYRDTFIFQLNSGDIVELKAISSTLNEVFDLEFFGFKL